jgi:hypothetical protein
MPRLAAATALILVLAVAGCGTVERDLQQADKGRSSAIATARLTADAWSRGEIRPRFAGLAFDAARQRVEKDRQTLAARAPKTDDRRVAAAIRSLESISASLAALAEAARRDDRGAAAAALGGMTAAAP